MTLITVDAYATNVAAIALATRASFRRWNVKRSCYHPLLVT